MEPVYFANAGELRKWFEKNHSKESELLVGYYKKSTGKPSITWPESVDQALCFGWIDGIRKSIDEERYCIRFTPRNPKSHWSAVNLEKIKKLKKRGLMKAPGLEVYRKRDKKRGKQASYEQKSIQLNEAYLSRIKQNKKAWKYFESSPPYYRKVCIHWIMSAKREETRMRRLDILIQSSAAGLKIPPMRIGEEK